jgi:UDP-N-acetylglucosamine 3-dehydrogenase
MKRVLLIGAGNMGRMHARCYGRMDGVQLVGIVDGRHEFAEPLANDYGATVFHTYEEASEILDQVDVIDICLPTFLHKSYVLKAAAAEKDVICEKPLAGNLEDAREMIEACRSHGVRLFVGHVLRFFPEYRDAKAVLENGTIGTPGVVRTSRGGVFPTAWRDWYADFQNSGGLVLDMIVHDFDFLRWCFGEVERVYAKGMLGRTFARMDYALVTLRFRSGVIAHVEGTWAHQGFSMKLEIAGSRGIIDYDSARDKPIVLSQRNTKESGGGVAVPESPLKDNPYYLELKHFIDCLELGLEPIVTAEDAYSAMQISLAAIRSIQTGEPVVLGEEGGMER